MQNPVKKMRNKIDVSQRDFADALGLSSNVIARIERGEQLSEETLEEIAEWAEVDAEVLIDKQKKFIEQRRKRKREEVKKKIKETDFEL